VRLEMERRRLRQTVAAVRASVAGTSTPNLSTSDKEFGGGLS
jgi:hypothetical protein